MILDSLFDILRFNIVLAETMIKAAKTLMLENLYLWYGLSKFGKFLRLVKPGRKEPVKLFSSSSDSYLMEKTHCQKE